jgi:hypothetical protein
MGTRSCSRCTPEQRQRWLAVARDTAERRIDMVVGNKHGGAYQRVAVLAIAYAEALTASTSTADRRGGRGGPACYMLAYMGDRYEVELEPEVREWLDTLPLGDYRTVEYHADRLAEAPTTLGEPYSRHLHGAVRELRFHLSRSAWRVSYWLAQTGGSCC